jgi:DNA-binding response OmpR family regulator
MVPHIVCLHQSFKFASQLASLFPKYSWQSFTFDKEVSFKKQPDLIILEHDSYHLLSKKLRDLDHYFERSKICIVTAHSSLEDRLAWIELGADECILKPYSLGECKVRLHRLLRYQKVSYFSWLAAGKLTFAPNEGAVLYDGQRKQLRQKESQILAHLFKYKNRVVTKDQLIDAIWPDEHSVPTYSTIDVYIRRLRINLGKPGKQLQTVRGFGYVLRDI